MEEYVKLLEIFEIKYDEKYLFKPVLGLSVDSTSQEE